MMGYSLTQKGYLLYNLCLKKFMVSRDAVFKLHIFPFSQLQDYYVPVFPAQPFLDPNTTVVTTSIENGGETEPIHDMVHDVVNDDHDQIVHTEVVAVDVPRTSSSKRTVYPPEGLCH